MENNKPEVTPTEIFLYSRIRLLQSQLKIRTWGLTAIVILNCISAALSKDILSTAINLIASLLWLSLLYTDKKSEI